MVVTRLRQMMECGNCTMCCYLVEIKAIDSPPFKYCKHCVPEKGCMVYSLRPGECRGYWCSWALDSNAHPSLRPDRCHVLFENVNEKIVLGIVEPSHEVDRLIAAQVDAFLRSGSSVVLKLVTSKPLIYLAKGAKARSVMRIINKRVRDYYNDSAKLYN